MHNKYSLSTYFIISTVNIFTYTYQNNAFVFRHLQLLLVSALKSSNAASNCSHKLYELHKDSYDGMAMPHRLTKFKNMFTTCYSALTHICCTVSETEKLSRQFSEETISVWCVLCATSFCNIHSLRHVLISTMI